MIEGKSIFEFEELNHSASMDHFINGINDFVELEFGGKKIRWYPSGQQLEDLLYKKHLNDRLRIRNNEIIEKQLFYNSLKILL